MGRVPGCASRPTLSHPILPDPRIPGRMRACWTGGVREVSRDASSPGCLPGLQRGVQPREHGGPAPSCDAPGYAAPLGCPPATPHDIARPTPPLLPQARRSPTPGPSFLQASPLPLCGRAWAEGGCGGTRGRAAPPRGVRLEGPGRVVRACEGAKGGGRCRVPGLSRRRRRPGPAKAVGGRGGTASVGDRDRQGQGRAQGWPPGQAAWCREVGGMGGMGGVRRKRRRCE